MCYLSLGKSNAAISFRISFINDAAKILNDVFLKNFHIQNAGITAETPYDECCELLIAEMQELTMVGTTGSMDWDATGAVTKSPTAVVIKDGAYVGM